MKQQALTAFEKYDKTTRRAQFLAEMEQVVPWTQLCALIEPIYPGARGQSASEVTVRVSARQTCLVGSIDLPCHDVGAKLRNQGTSLNANIHVIADPHARYQAVSAALKSLRDAGFRHKVGYVNNRE